MFDKSVLKDVLVQYKQVFATNWWEKERYKWEAVKWFQDNWDVNSPDFAEMLNRSLDKTINLLVSRNNFPKNMIVSFAKTAPEEVRAVFINLYDESRDLVERIESFKLQSDELLQKYGDGAAQHYQKENSICTYLWLRYPDKYYIYKYGEIKTVADVLKSDYQFKRGAYSDNLRNFLRFYDEISKQLKEDSELVDIFQSKLTNACYPDSELKTLTIDVGFYISRVYSKQKDESQADAEFDETDIKMFSDDWAPTLQEYSPGFSKEQWLDLLINKGIVGPVYGGILAAFYEAGGAATCKQIARKYHRTPSEISGCCTQFTKRIHKDTQCPLFTRDNGKKMYWPILFQGKKAGSDFAGSFIWKLRPELYDALSDFDIMRFQWKIEDENPVESNESEDSYTKNDFLNEVYMTENRYDNVVSVLRNKKNIILQGAPGVGKTFAAKRLAWSMIGEKDDERIEFVQFHQNYSYEDFVMGYKPVESGFNLKYGIFYRFCQKAANHPDKEFFFIIDEINRGNMSKIFGELLMLIEKDYRGTKATMAYNGLPFYVPKNLYIIGMMNTADRSLAMIDYALRRRFSFFEIEPGFDSEGFIKYQKSLNNETLNELILKVKELNREISLDKSLGKGFCIGHSYFCNRKGSEDCTEEWLRSVVEYDILPMLSEYWFDDINKLQRWENILQGVFQ